MSETEAPRVRLWRIEERTKAARNDGEYGLDAEFAGYVEWLLRVAKAAEQHHAAAHLIPDSPEVRVLHDALYESLTPRRTNI